MMRMGPRRARPRPSIDEQILPLVNIVFLLLIFFMVAGRLTASDPFDIEAPQSIATDRSPDGPPTVLVTEDGRIGLDGREIGDRAMLRAAIKRRFEGSKDGLLRLKIDGRSDAQRMVALIELLRSAGATDIRILTKPGGDG